MPAAGDLEFDNWDACRCDENGNNICDDRRTSVCHEDLIPGSFSRLRCKAVRGNLRLIAFVLYCTISTLRPIYIYVCILMICYAKVALDNDQALKLKLKSYIYHA